MNYDTIIIIIFLVTCFLGDAKPDWRDLTLSVIPKYAVCWETLGAILGLQEHEIAVISRNNAKLGAVEGCTEMMRKWLQSIEQPTWGKLDDAVKLLKGIYRLSYNHYL